MILQLINLPVEAESPLGPDLNELVDKVSRVEGPSFREVTRSNLRLLEIALSELPLHLLCRRVRELLEHACMGYHSEGIVINGCFMCAVKHDFWSSVPIGANEGLLHARLCGLSNPKVCDLQVALLVKEHVGWLEVFVHKSLLVHGFETEDDAGNEKLGLLFSEAAWLLVIVV